MSAAEQLEPSDIGLRHATQDEITLIRSTWLRRFWARSRLAMPAYDATGFTPRDDFGNVISAKAVYAGFGSQDSPRSILLHGDLLRDMAATMIDKILATPSVRVVVACFEDIPEPMGWACWDGPLLHYVFVRDDYRRQRVATRLVQATGCSAASHVTPIGRPLMKHLRRGD